MKENKRLKVMMEVLAGERTAAWAARILGLSERQVFRLKPRIRDDGAFGIVHGNRGRPSPRRLSEKVREQILVLRKHGYDGFNDTHFTDELRETEGMNVGRETVRSLLRASGIPSLKKAKKRRHRRRREPKARFGEMLQGDASHHDWLEGRGPWLTLVHFVDDATNRQWADFFDAETTEGYLRVMWGVLNLHGIPLSLYVDRHSVFRVNREDTIAEQLTGKAPLTQFARAMEELMIPIIFAPTAGQGKS